MRAPRVVATALRFAPTTDAAHHRRQSYGFWQSPIYPNATTNHSAEQVVSCGLQGCLFNIETDPSEYVDLAPSMPDKLAAMFALFQKRNATTFEANKLGCFTVGNPECEANIAACHEYVASHGGFYGPFVPDVEHTER